MTTTLLKIPLARIAHARSGDKADWVDFGLFAWNEAGYRLIEREVTAAKVQAHFAPWLPGQVAHFLATGELLPDPPLALQQQLMVEHVAELHRCYGDVLGPRIARKHVGWYLAGEAHRDFRAQLNGEDNAAQQLRLLAGYFIQRQQLAKAGAR